MHLFFTFVKFIRCRLICFANKPFSYSFQTSDNNSSFQANSMWKHLASTTYNKKVAKSTVATRIIWVFSEWQPDYDMIHERYSSIEFDKGWGDEIFDMLSHEQQNILVLDNQVGVSSSSSSVADLFTKWSHHRNLTVIYLVQNVYNHGKSQRTIFLNSHYSVLFCNGRDASQFRTMAYQICPNNRKCLLIF